MGRLGDRNCRSNRGLISLFAGWSLQLRGSVGVGRRNVGFRRVAVGFVPYFIFGGVRHGMLSVFCFSHCARRMWLGEPKYRISAPTLRFRREEIVPSRCGKDSCFAIDGFCNVSLRESAWGRVDVPPLGIEYLLSFWRCGWSRETAKAHFQSSSG